MKKPTHHKKKIQKVVVTVVLCILLFIIMIMPICATNTQTILSNFTPLRVTTNAIRFSDTSDMFMPYMNNIPYQPMSGWAEATNDRIDSKYGLSLYFGATTTSDVTVQNNRIAVGGLLDTQEGSNPQYEFVHTVKADYCLLDIKEKGEYLKTELKYHVTDSYMRGMYKFKYTYTVTYPYDYVDHDTNNSQFELYVLGTFSDTINGFPDSNGDIIVRPFEHVYDDSNINERIYNKRVILTNITLELEGSGDTRQFVSAITTSNGNSGLQSLLGFPLATTPITVNYVGLDNFNFSSWATEFLDGLFSVNVLGPVTIGAVVWFIVGLGLLFLLLKLFAGG